MSKAHARRLIEAQVEFGMFPVNGGGVLVGDVQERVIQDASAARVARANHAEAVKQPRTYWHIEALHELADSVRAQGRAGKLWPRIAQALIDADFVEAISDREHLSTSHDKADLKGITVTMTQAGMADKTVSCATVYDHVMLRKKYTKPK